jgi:hypothetical protein
MSLAVWHELDVSYGLNGGCYGANLMRSPLTFVVCENRSSAH